jgi:hypothetical protein
LVVGFVIKVLIFTLTIFLFGLELFWNGIKTVLVWGSLRLADHCLWR